jgi:hypothetical protein
VHRRRQQPTVKGLARLAAVSRVGARPARMAAKGAPVRLDADRIEIVNGAKRAVFLRTIDGWAPDWFYQGGRPMLRFKDHEWLSVGHVRPCHAVEVKRIRRGAVFGGACEYGGVRVAWTVRVAADSLGGGFTVETTFVAAEAVELLEAYTAFETPYEYDGSEHVTTVIGMNPVSQWRGGEQVTPPIWKHPAWVYSRPQAVRITGPCSAPYLCQALAGGDGSNARYTTVVGDWTVCRVRDLYATPTRTVVGDGAGAGEAQRRGLRGYKFIVGALNWSSAFAKDPNVLFKARVKHRQRVAVDFDGAMPGGSLDAMLLAAWERAAAADIPPDGRTEALDLAKRRGVSWSAATEWLRGVFCGRGAEGLFRPAEGLVTYAPGTRPKFDQQYSWYWWPQWAGHLRYRALVLNDGELAAACDRYDAEFAARAGRFYYNGPTIAVSISVLPSLWWMYGCGGAGPLADALRGIMAKAAETSRAENGRPRDMDYGFQAVAAEAFLLSAKVFGDPAQADQARVLLAEINEQLDGRFWEFNVAERSNMMHGGQIRPMGHGHAALANYLAWLQCGRPEHLAAARRFARLLVAIQYASHNGSADPEFDWRGWANGTNAGRDQYAEFPPWETSNSLLAVAAMIEDQDLDPGIQQCLWYFARTGLAQFPAARTLKRVLDESMHVRYVPRDSIGSERGYYDTLPYLAYENPHDQTLLASYQGTDCLLGELVFGGRLASADDGRLSVLVPRAARMDAREVAERLVYVWNPLEWAVGSTVTVRWPDGSTAAKAVEVPPRSGLRVEFAG